MPLVQLGYPYVCIAIPMPLVALGYPYHGILCSTSCLSFFYIRQGGTGRNISGSAGTVVGAVALIILKMPEMVMGVMLAIVHGCSHKYAGTCCRPYRVTTRHATAERVQKAGWTKDGSVHTIAGTSSPAPGTSSTEKHTSSGETVSNFVQNGMGHGIAQTLGLHSGC